MTKRIGTTCSQRIIESGSPRFASVLLLINPKHQSLGTPFYINERTRELEKVDLEAQNDLKTKINLLTN